MTIAVKEIRALTRGVQVVQTLCRSGACSLADLHRETGLPKSTLRRILFTFEQANFLRCSLADGLYRANIQMPDHFDVTANPLVGRIVAAAKPALVELSAKAEWPTDLMVRNGTHLCIVETSRALSPFPVNRLEIGENVAMLKSAVGRAYLAFCPESERTEILQKIDLSDSSRNFESLPSVLEEIRANGYAERAPFCTGGTQQHPLLNDNLHAIAVPVLKDEHVICCINLLWRPTAIQGAGEKDRMLMLLREAAGKIAANYQA